MYLQDRLTISSLTLTRKIQVENYRRISKQKTSNLEVEVGMVAYIRIPKFSGKRKKYIQEPYNIQIEFLPRITF